MEIFTPDQKLMALSWRQPYAQLMLHGKIETRTWNTKYRGWVLICASKKGYKSRQIINISGISIYWEIIEKSLRAGEDLIKNRGHAIAIGKLVDCRPMRPEDKKLCFVEYHHGLFCHIYENVQAIVPIPWKGVQGWKEVTVEIKQNIQVIGT